MFYLVHSHYYIVVYYYVVEYVVYVSIFNVISLVLIGIFLHNLWLLMQ